MKGRWVGLVSVVAILGCREPNPDWMGPDDDAASDGTPASDGATSSPTPSSESGDSPSCHPNMEMLCGTVCVRHREDEQNCGDCGVVCPEGQMCRSGSCE